MGEARNKAGRGKNQPARYGMNEQRPRGNLDERWLERKVRDMYQEVVDEPVPKELLEIVKRIPKLDD
jgi:hypothetical protein